MKRMLLKLSFDGTGYHGWQVQPNGVTVQETLQHSIEKVLKKPVPITGCSRTDAGVHAREFCCHVDCEESLPDTAFLCGVNSCLPKDIVINDCFEVCGDFHARYSCKSKKYIYYFYCGKRDPFIDRYALFLERKPHIDLINAFCERIKGKHDFFGFSSSGRTVDDTVRTVFDCLVYEKGPFICLEIRADGFLYNMVRIIAGTALEVGYGKLKPDIAEDIFKTNDRSLGGNTLRAKGLFLESVNY